MSAVKYEEEVRICAELSEIAESPHLGDDYFKDVFKRYLEYHHDSGDYIDDPISLLWLTEAVEVEVEVVGEDGLRGAQRVVTYPNVEAFVRRVPNLLEFFKSLNLSGFGPDLLIHCSALLESVPSGKEREELVEFLFLNFNARNGAWVPTCLSCDLSREFLASLVLKELEKTTPDKELKFNCSTYASDFISYGNHGYGNPREDPRHKRPEWLRNFDKPLVVGYASEWSLFASPHLLSEALKIAGTKSPSTLFSEYSKLNNLFGEDSTFHLLDEVVDELDTVLHQNLAVLRRLRMSKKKALARRLKPCSNSYEITAGFLAQLVEDHKDEGFLNFFNGLKPTLKKIGAINTFRAFCKHARAKQKKYREVQLFIVQLLKEEGLFVGKVQVGYFQKNNRKTKQLEVHSGRNMYIRSRDYVGTGFYPEEGEIVLVFTRGATRITNNRGREVYVSSWYSTRYKY